MDVVAIAINKNYIDELFRTVNEYHLRLKFIIEKGDNFL